MSIDASGLRIVERRARLLGRSAPTPMPGIGDGIETMTITTLAAPRILDDLTGIYAFKEPEDIASFLEAHPFLVPLLIEARPVIAHHFPDVPVVLELVSEPDIEDEEEAAALTVLFALIEMDLPLQEARRRLHLFDQGWWLARARRADCRLEFDVRHVRTSSRPHT